MANVRSGNSWYVDVAYTTSADDMVVSNLLVMGILLTATAANAQIVLSDVTTGAKKLDVRVAASGSSQYFDFSNAPVQFINGIRVTTLSNAVATLIGRTQGG